MSKFRLWLFPLYGHGAIELDEDFETDTVFDHLPTSTMIGNFIVSYDPTSTIINRAWDAEMEQNVVCPTIMNVMGPIVVMSLQNEDIGVLWELLPQSSFNLLHRSHIARFRQRMKSSVY